MKHSTPLLLFLILFSFPAAALERFEIITTEELRHLLDERDAENYDFILVNTLDTIIANHHSIPGSLNIPWSEIKQKAHLLGEDKDKPVITYCMGYR